MELKQHWERLKLQPISGAEIRAETSSQLGILLIINWFNHLLTRNTKHYLIAAFQMGVAAGL